MLSQVPPPFIPFGDRVVIKPEVVEKTSGGIFLPEEHRAELEHAIGLVVFVGDGSRVQGNGVPVGEMRTKVGMRVQYYTLRAVKIGDVTMPDGTVEKELVVVTEQDVIGARPPAGAAS